MMIPRSDEQERLFVILLDQNSTSPIAVTTSFPETPGLGKTSLVRAVCQDHRIQQRFSDGVTWFSPGRNPTLFSTFAKIDQYLYSQTGHHQAFEDWADVGQCLRDFFQTKCSLIVVDDANSPEIIETFLQIQSPNICLFINRYSACLPKNARCVYVNSLKPEESAALLTHGWGSAQIPITGDFSVKASAAREWGKSYLNDRSQILKQKNLKDESVDPEPAPHSAANDAPTVPIQRLSVGQNESSQVQIMTAITALSAQLNHWPLALSLIHHRVEARIREVKRDEPIVPIVESELRSIQKIFHTFQLKANWRLDDPAACQQVFRAVLTVSMIPLSVEDCKQAFKLVIFPEGESVPLRAVQVLWNASPSETEQLVERLDCRGLVCFDREREVLLIPIAVQRCLKEQFAQDSLVKLNQRFTDNYRMDCPEQQWMLGPEDGYFLPNLPRHLAESNRGNEACNLFFDFAWLERYLVLSPEPARRERSILGLLQDIDAVIPLLTGRRSNQLRLLQQVLRLSGPVLARDPERLAEQLARFCLWIPEPEFQALAQQAKAQLRRKYGPAAVQGLELEKSKRSMIFSEVNLGIVNAETFANGEDLVVLGQDGRLVLWNLVENTERKILYHGHDQPRDPRSSGEKVHSMPMDPQNWPHFVRKALVITNDGHWAFTARENGIVRRYDLRSGTSESAFTTLSQPLGGVRFTPDGNLMLVCAKDGGIELWDPWHGELQVVLTGHGDAVQALAVTADSRTMISGAKDHSIGIWDLDHGLLMHVLNGHQGPVSTVTISPDGYLAVSGSLDGTARVWDLWTGEMTWLMDNLNAAVSAVVVTADQRFLVCGCSDGTMHLFDFQSRERVAMVWAHECAVNDLICLNDGKTLISISAQFEAQIWDLGMLRTPVSEKIIQTRVGSTGIEL